MSELEHEFEEHAIHQTISQIEDSVSKLDEEEIADLDVLDSLRRARRFVDVVKSRLAAADALLTSQKTLNDLNQRCASILQELNTFIGNRNPGHIRNVSNQIDSALQSLRQVFVNESEVDVESVRSSVATFRRSVGQLLSNLESQSRNIESSYSKTQSELESLSNAIETQKARLDNAITDFQKKFSASESERGESYNEELEKYEERVAGIIASAKNAHENLLSDVKQRVDEGIEEFSKSSSATLHELNERLGEAKEIVGIIANTGMAGGFQQMANQARRSATTWQVSTVISIVGLIGFAIWAFILATRTPSEGEFTSIAGIEWGSVGVRAFVATAFGVLAAYCARRGERHEHTERRYRQAQLELASINPYLEDLPETERNEVKRQLATRIFGRDVPSEPRKKAVEGTSSDVVLQALEAVIELVKEVGPKR